jgi:glycosyltransferase involved in cell wall biosynthesis
MAGFAKALEAAPAARHHGPYEAAVLPRLMAQIDWVVVPSIWWENAPLVIQEAFLHRRPVICGNIGGMAEMVRDGIDGLHATVGDPAGLAAVLRRAVETEGLWDRLAGNIRPPLTIEAAALRHLDLYRDTLGARAA